MKGRKKRVSFETEANSSLKGFILRGTLWWWLLGGNLFVSLAVYASDHRSSVFSILYLM